MINVRMACRINFVQLRQFAIEIGMQETADRPDFRQNFRASSPVAMEKEIAEQDVEGTR